MDVLLAYENDMSPKKCHCAREMLQYDFNIGHTAGSSLLRPIENMVAEQDRMLHLLCVVHVV